MGMGFKETLELIISGNAQGAISALESTASAAEKSGTTVESSMKRIGAASMKIGVSGLAAGAFLTELGSKEEAAGQQLEASITAVGQSYDDFKDRIHKTSDEQAKFGHTNVEVDQALSALTLSYKDTGAALDQMQLVADLAAFKHIGLAEAATIVAKAHGGAGRVFKEFGIQVEKNADGTKNYDGALGELATRLHGQASAAVDTWTGKLKVLGTEIENQVAAFGAKYGPAIMAGSAALTAFGGVAQGVAAIQAKVTAAHLATADAAAADAAAHEALVVADAEVVGSTAASVSALYAEETALTASSAAFGAWGIAVGAAIVLASEAIDIWGAKQEHSFDNVSQYAAMSGQDIADVFQNLHDEGNWSDGKAEDVQKLFDALSTGGETGIGVLKRYREQLVLTGGDTTAVDAALNKATDAQININAATADGTTKAKTYDQSLKDLHDTIHAGIDPLFAMETALANNAKAQADATAAQNDGKKSLEEKSAADLHAAETALGVHDASIALAGAMREGKVSVDGAKDDLALWVSQGLLTQQQADNVAYSLGILADRANALDGKTVNLSVVTTYTDVRGHSVTNALGDQGNLVHAAAGAAFTTSGPVGMLVGEGGEAEDVLVVPHSKGGIGAANVVFAPVINVSAMDVRGVDLAVLEALHSAVRTYDVPDAIKNAFAA